MSPKFNPTRREEKAIELEQVNQLGEADPEGDLFLSIMQAGIEYRVSDFFAVLPAGHRILSIKTVKGRDTAIGVVMDRLARIGRVRRVNARHATFALASAKVVPLKR